MSKFEPALLFFVENMGRDHELLGSCLQMCKLLVGNAWGFAKSFHKISIALNLSPWLILLLAYSIFLGISPCISGCSLCDGHLLLVPWRLLMLVLSLLRGQTTRLLLGTRGVFRETTPILCLWLWLYVYLYFSVFRYLVILWVHIRSLYLELRLLALRLRWL